MKAVLFVLLILSGSLLAKSSQTDTLNSKLVIHAVRANEQIKIDGILDENVWNNGQGETKLYQRDPAEGANPTEKTELFISYDDEAIYVAAKLYDSKPDSIVSRLGRRDNFVSSDQFVFFIDPYHDKQTGYYFGIYVSGTLFDGVLFNDSWEDNSWDGVWEGKSVITDYGWTAELKIPYSQIRFHKKDEYVWGVNFKRVIQRKNEADYVRFTPKDGSGFVSRFVELKGITNITPASRIEILPYAITKAEYTQHSANDPFNDGSRYNPGFGADMKIGLGSNLMLNATVNPDFGQVEVDPAVVNLSDVETYFEEKRPFFIEGFNTFNFGSGGSNSFWGFNWAGSDLFYSRRIGRAPQGSLPDNDYADIPLGTSILGAAKLTGKVGGSWNLGIINGVTAREKAQIQFNDTRSDVEVEPLTYYGVYRIQSDFNDGKQGFGAMSTITNRFFKDKSLEDNINSSAYVIGLDGWTFLDNDKSWVLTGWGAASHVKGTTQRMASQQNSSLHYFQRPDADYISVDSTRTSLSGYSGRFTLNKQKGNIYINSALGVVSPGYNVNDLGFMWRNDAINFHFVAGYKWTEPGKVIRRANINAAAFRNMDFGRNITWEGLFHNGNITFINYYYLNWRLAYNPETINNRRTRGGPLTRNHSGYETGVYVSTDSRKVFVMGASIDTYTSMDNDWVSYSLEFEWKPSSNLTLMFTPGYQIDLTDAQWIGAFEDSYAAATYQKRYIFAELNQRTLSAGIRVNWTFTPDLSFQLYAQPLISSGEYTRFKELQQPKTYDYKIYDPADIVKTEEDIVIDPDKTGPASPYSFSNPDFTIVSLRGNAVLRWEYLPGSILYLVWTQSRGDFTDDGRFSFNRSFNRMFDTRSDNIFMLKFTYWFNM